MSKSSNYKYLTGRIKHVSHTDNFIMIVINFKDTGITSNGLHAVLMVPSLGGANEIATALITHQRQTSLYCLPCHSETDQ